MNKFLVNPLIILGTVIVTIAISLGGWVLIDELLEPYAVYGTRALYQEASRAVTMNQPVVYQGTEYCGQCHPPIEQEWLHSAHKTVACEDCHGPGGPHLSNTSIDQIDTANLCLTCHASLASRPDTFPQVDPGEHSGGLVCTACHNPMHPDSSQPPLMPHTFYQVEQCLICHGSQSFRPVPANHEDRPVEGCPRCHIMRE